MKQMTLYAMSLLLISSSPALASKGRHFTENKGQVTDQYLAPRRDIDFKLSAGHGLNVFIGKGMMQYQWAKPVSTTTDAESGTEHTSYELYRMDVTLLGANPNARPQVAGKQSAYERYFQPWVNSTNSNQGVQAFAYNRITYENIYPNIDWVFYFNHQGQLEHDFLVRPGGRVSDIKVQYRGTDRLYIGTDSSLHATTPLGSLKENAPIAYDATGRRVPVQFVLDNDVLQFKVADYSGTLTIDPVVEWGSYFGGAANDAGMDITTDGWGHVYLCGSTNSVANIATTGAHQATFGGAGNDAFLSKWHPDGSLLWATYYGGTNVDIARGVACDTLGNVYFGGGTNSNSGIATSGSFQDTFIAFAQDAFLVKMDSSGLRLWGTYFGGFSNHDANTNFAICVDDASNIYLTGNTQSVDFPGTSGAHQTALGGGQDAFVAKFDANGGLSWSTYLGGLASDFGTCITSDASGNIYIGGYSQSTTNIATAGSYQSVNAGGQDAFVAKFNTQGQRLWSTYYGGSGTDRCFSIDVKGDKLVLAGLTNSVAGIATVQAHQVQKNAGDDGFFCMFDTSGVRHWASYFGTEGPDHVQSISIADNWAVYISGASTGDTGISTAGSLNELRAGSKDFFLAKFDTMGIQAWGTYYGGVDAEALGISRLHQARIYLTGNTQSASGIAAANGAQQTANGGTDALVVCFNDCEAPPLNGNITGPDTVCAQAASTYAITVDSDLSVAWELPNGWTGFSDSASLQVVAGATSGIIKVWIVNDCGRSSDTLQMAVTVNPLPEPEIISNGSLLSATQSYAAYQWRLNGTDIPGATQASHLANTHGTYDLVVADSSGCSGFSNQVIIDEDLDIQYLANNSAVAIYPNPVTNYLTLQLPHAGTCTVYNVIGQAQIADITIRQGMNYLDLRNLAKGVYFVKLTMGDQTYVAKILKE